MMETKLPDGFKFASEIPEGKDEVWHQQPEEAYKPKKGRPTKLRVESLREAIQIFRYEVDATKLQDVSLEGRRVAALFRRDEDEKTFVVMFKREFYIHFSKHFMHVPEEGYGLLANHKLVHWSAMEGHRIAAVFPDGRAYWIDAMEFIKYYEEYETECPKLPGEIAAPLSMWKRLF